MLMKKQANHFRKYFKSNIHPDYLPAFDTYPELVDLDITKETVVKTARQLKGAAGAGGTDSETIASWLLKCGCQMTILLGLPTVL